MKKLTLFLVLCGVLAACETPTRFVWGDYEDRLYRYYKDPEARDAYRASLEKAINIGEEEDKIAPGLLAELGYLALEDGDKDAAIALFEREKLLFPESTFFMDSIIKRLNESDTGGAGDDDAELVS